MVELQYGYPLKAIFFNDKYIIYKNIENVQ
jgi:hypothetical protein